MQTHVLGFNTRGEFTRKNIRDACFLLGISDGKIQSDMVAQSEKLKHGLYKFGRCTPVVNNIKSNVDVTVVSLASNIYPMIKTTIASPKNIVSIPELEPGYIPFGTYKQTEKILTSRKFFPVYITGPSGNGKSSMILNICAKHKIPMVRINCSVQSDEEKLIGSKTLIDGNISVIEGPILVAMRAGAIAVLEEIDALDTRLALVLQGICEGRPYFFPLTGELIKPTPGFNIVGIGNTKGTGSADGKYIGTNLHNAAFLERFGCTLEQKFPTPSEELKMVLNWMGVVGVVDTHIASALVKWADTVRRTHADGGLDDIISTRRLNHIVVANSIYNDIYTAIELCTNRFDAFTSAAFRDLFDKIYVAKDTDNGSAA